MFRMDLPAEPGAKLVVAMGVVAALIAGAAMANNDQIAAGWAGAALFSVGLWLVWPRPARKRK